MPFGLHLASMTFQRLLDNVEEFEPNVFEYLNDIIVITLSQEHLQILREIFDDYGERD